MALIHPMLLRLTAEFSTGPLGLVAARQEQRTHCGLEHGLEQCPAHLAQGLLQLWHA